MGLESLNLSGGNEGITDLVKIILDKTNIELKSELTGEEIGIILEIIWHSELLKDENKDKEGLVIFEEKIIPKFLQLKVSKDRASRKEVEKILSSIAPTFIEQQTNLAKGNK